MFKTVLTNLELNIAKALPEKNPVEILSRPYKIPRPTVINPDISYNNDMKYLILLCLFISSASVFAECASRNHIFLIHGIGGGETTFGVMDQYLNKINPCNKATVFVYSTGDSALSTYNFADDLNSFITTHYNENKISDADKISFIMHSQGGLVGSLWLLNAKYSQNELYKKVDSFITLSTPYWGSTMAIVGQKFFFTLPEEMDNPISPLGRIELQEMSFGSATISAIQQNFNDLFLDTHVRFLAVGGLKRNYNPYYGEDDTTVSAYSSNPNHFSVDADKSGTSTIIDRSEEIPFIPVMATHFKIEIPGVAKLDDKCILKDECNHPSIEHIVRHLAHKKTKSDKKHEFRKYRVHVYVNGWEEHLKDDSDLVVHLTKPHGETEKIDLDFKPGKTLSASFSGILDNTKTQNIKLEFRLKNKTLSTIKAKVKGGLSTFINYNLK